jgi:MSHA pilin protein MshD
MCGASERPRLGRRFGVRFSPPARRRQRGVTLVEIVMFVLIVGIAVSSVLGTLSLTGGRSADALVQRQAVAIAESLLQEIEAQPFTALSPDGTAEAIGPEPGESRSSSTTPFNHVNDYHGYAMNGIVALDGSAIASLESYSASVTVSAQALGNIPATEGLLIRVTVTGPGGTPVSLTGFRARLAP